jgi:hypothetical protein
MILDCFDVLILKLIFLKKYYFDAFSSKKYFEKQSLPQFLINTTLDVCLDRLKRTCI